MDNNDFKLNETGINPVDTASENNDIYFTNVNSENYEQNKTEVSKPKAKSTAQTVVKKAPVRKSKG